MYPVHFAILNTSKEEQGYDNDDSKDDSDHNDDDYENDCAFSLILSKRSLAFILLNLLKSHDLSIRARSVENYYS